MKSAIYAVIIIVMFGSCLVAITANHNASSLKQNLEQERYAKIIAEEKLEKANVAIKKLNIQFEEANKKILSVQTIIDQGSTTNDDLKAQLNNVTQLKDSLEQKMAELVKKINELEGNPQASEPAFNTR